MAYNNREYRGKHKEQGLCVDCVRPALPYHRLCDYHLRKHNAITREQARLARLARVKQGVCPRCGRERDDEKLKYCLDCREQTSRRNRI